MQGRGFGGCTHTRRKGHTEGAYRFVYEVISFEALPQWQIAGFFQTS
jgi:hypothetical protein